MHSFVILEKKKDYQAIAEGFSFNFLIFNVLFLLYHRMYSSALLFVSVFGILNYMLGSINEAQHMLIVMFLYLVIALKINELRIFSFEQNGYKKKAAILAFNPTDAKLRYFSHG